MSDILRLFTATACSGVFVVSLVTAAYSQQRPDWTISVQPIDGGESRITATTIAERRTSDPTRYELTLTCDADHRRTSISSNQRIAWQTSPRDPRESYLPLDISVDDGRARRAALLRQTDATGDFATVVRVMRSEAEPAGVDQMFTQWPFTFAGFQVPARRVVVSGISQNPIEFAFDTLTASQRKQLDGTCFAMEARQAAERACKQQARALATQAFETRFHDATREWCDGTREARRQQLLAEFLRGVAAARNGGPRLATAFGELIALNPDVVVAEETGVTQSCPDPHFRIDTERLRPVLQRAAPGQTVQADVVSRQLTELLNEPGVIVSTTRLQFTPPQPRMDYQAWTAAIASAEAPCLVRR